MPNTIHYGDTHIFTSRNSNNTITLKAGDGETLNVETLSTTAITTDSLSQSATNTELHIPDITNVQTFNHSSTSIAKNQGTNLDIATDPNTLTEYLISACPSTTSDGPTVGGLAIFSRAYGVTNFSQDYLLTYVQYTFSSANWNEKKPTYCSIDQETASVLAYGDSWGINSAGVLTPGNLYFYRRTGSVWAIEFSLVGTDGNAPPYGGAGANAISVGISGDYAIIGYSNDSVRINKRSGTSWNTTAQILQAGTTGITFISLVAICDSGASCAYVDTKNKTVSVWTRAAETWYILKTFDSSVSEGNILSMSFKSGFLVYNTSESLYIKNISQGISQTFHLGDSLGKVNIDNSANYVIVSSGSLFFYVYSRYGKYFTYATFDGVSGTAISGITNTASSIILGQPSEGVSGNHKRFSMSLSSTIQEINKIDITENLNITSLYPIRVYSSLITSGDITANGQALGYLDYASWASDTTQSLSNNTETVINNFTLSTDKVSSIYVLSTNQILTSVKGIYLITLSVTFASNATGYRQIRILKNGSAIETFMTNSISGVSTICALSGLVIGAVDDYFTTDALQNSGGALNVSACKFKILKISNT